MNVRLAPAEIRTPRLLLRALSAHDVDGLWPHVSDPALPRYMTWEHHNDRSETAAFVARMVAARAEGTAVVWAVFDEGALCGVVGLHDIKRRQLAWRLDCAELGYWIGAAHRGRGLATEAIAAVLHVAFTELALHKVSASCVTENVASLRVLARAGFRDVGIARAHFERFGRWWDLALVELLDADWQVHGGRPAGPAHT